MRPSTANTTTSHVSDSTLAIPQKTEQESYRLSVTSNEALNEPRKTSPAARELSENERDPEESRSLEKQQPLDTDAAWSEDPANPQNWSFWRKWKNVGVVSFYTFISPLASSMMAPGLEAVAKLYDIQSPTVVALTLSIYLLAFAVGPLFVGPLSEMYGRTWVLHISNLFFLVFSLACIFAPNTSSLIAFRFLSGLGGSTPVSIGGGSVSDLFNAKERSTAMSIYTMGPLVGPVLGPIVGGFVVQTIGIRWVFILLTILAAVGSLVGLTFLEETYAPVIKERLRKRRGIDIEAGEKPVDSETPVQMGLAQSLRLNLSRPFLLLTRSLICFMLSLYMALIYGYLYLMFTTFPALFSEVYGWGPGISGLAYLGPGIGFFCGTLAGAPMLTYIYSTLCARNGGQGKPEFRIPLMFIGSGLVPIGLFWYGWSAQARTHWIMPIIGGGIFTAGQMLVYIPIMLYLVDAFTFAASALAAASVFRALFGFLFPLFGEQMFAALGFGGGTSLLAGMAIATGIPFPIWLYFRGEQMRLKNPLNR